MKKNWIPVPFRKNFRIARKLLKYPYRQARALWLRKHVDIRKDSARFIAHRGLSGEAPENTVRAFELAAERHFHAMETDIRRTRDHQLVLMHDDSLKRMCGVDIPVADLTYEELSAIPITGGNHIEDYLDDEKARYVPLLSEYLVICKESGMIPMMELKDGWKAKEPLDDEYLTDILNQVREIIGSRPVIYVSFNLESLISLKRLYEEQDIHHVSFFHLVKRINPAKLPEYRKNGINLSVQGKKNSLAALRLVRDAGLLLVVWTIDDLDTARLYVRDKIEWIASNIQLWEENV